MIKFGVAGESLSFFNEGHKSTMEAGSWCAARGIDIFEYSFGKGINISDKTASAIGEEFLKDGVELSVHAPYYINFANPDSEMIEKSIGYVTNSIIKLQKFGNGERIVFHPASQGKMDRTDAVNLTKSNLIKLKDTLEGLKLDGGKVCIETMGKLGQIGTLEEIVDFCNLAECFYPCIDFGHLNARTLGGYKTSDAFDTAIRYMLDNLPTAKVVNMHVHFSKIMYSAKGEVKHLTFADEEYGPDFHNLAPVLKKYQLEPTIICESDGTQAEDAITMKNIYFNGTK